jgi:small-conductance mechanosensitive channel
VTIQLKRSVICICTLVLICISSLSATAQIPGFGSFKTAPKVNLEELSNLEATEYLATLTDAESRKLLLEQIEAREQKVQKADTMMGGSYVSFAIMSLQKRSQQFNTGLRKIRASGQNYGQNLAETGHTLFYKDGQNKLPKVLLILALILAASLVFAILVFKPVNDFRETLRQDGEFAVYNRLARSIAGLALDLAKIALFALTSIIATLLLVAKGSPIQVFASSILLLFASVWAIRDAFRELLFSPVCKELFIKGDHSRKIFYRSMLSFFIPVSIAMNSSAVLVLLKFPVESLQLNTLLLITLAVLSLIIGTFLIARAKRLHDDGEQDVLKSAVSNNRYWLVIIALIIFYSIAFKNIVIAAEMAEGERLSPGNLYYALLMFIFMPMYMRIVRLLVIVQPIKMAVPEIEEHIAGQVSPKGSKYNKWVRWLFTVPYAMLVFLFTMEGANIGILSWFSEGAGSEFGEAATGVFVACMLGVVTWNIVNTYINKNLPAAVLDPTVLMGSEGGGDEQATRIQTILPIVRNFALVIIIVVVLFSVLSSLGVNTAPLLAGAGVMGIAIGFGAQKLVQDVVSGMFFLFEDAFRIGEYIDTGSLVGTVESTSVRSLRLRHHLGAVQTIPYGEIRSVKNLSRDFVIMKLKFRVPFDTDIEVVRKTIKKVGEALLKDEELGEGFIAPLKSQGVQTAEDDALVIRMKFTSKPGKQWMIKRSAYRLVQEALAEKGIHFASRQVTVHVPENEGIDTEKLKQAAGAAALAIDAEKSNKPVDPLEDM